MFNRGGAATTAARGCAQSATAKLQRISWAKLLHRMGGWEMETCPRCGAGMATLRLVTNPDEVRRTLDAWSDSHQAEPRRQPKARAPPGVTGQLALAFA